MYFLSFRWNARFVISGVMVVLAILILSFTRERKRLFVLGDSISLQYGEFLKEYLRTDFILERKGSEQRALQNLDVPVDANAGDSRMVLAYLRTTLSQKDFKPDLMILNCGLHDIKRNVKTGSIAVDTVEYRNNLEEISKLIRNKHIPLIWVRSTEVVDSVHAVPGRSFDRFADDLEQYNRIADGVFNKHQVPIIDLYSFTKLQGRERFVDHVHYNPQVRRLQAAYIAGFIASQHTKSYIIK